MKNHETGIFCAKRCCELCNKIFFLWFFNAMQNAFEALNRVDNNLSGKKR